LKRFKEDDEKHSLSSVSLEEQLVNSQEAVETFTDVLGFDTMTDQDKVNCKEAAGQYRALEAKLE